MTNIVEPDMARFDGDVYVPEVDDARLRGQQLAVFDLMRDGEWRTLSQIELATGAPAASVSAQLRHLRKERFGSYLVEKRRVGNASDGLWEYRVGARGAHTPQHSTMTDEQIRWAETWLGALESALARCDPYNVVLATYRDHKTERPW